VFSSARKDEEPSSKSSGRGGSTGGGTRLGEMRSQFGVGRVGGTFLKRLLFTYRF